MTNEIMKLAKTITDYSIDVKANEKVLIIYYDDNAKDLVKELIRCINLKYAIPSYKRVDKQLDALLLRQNSEDIINVLINQFKFEIESFNSIIYIRSTQNEYEEKSIPMDIKNLYNSLKRPYDYIRINERKWVILNYPTLMDAYKAKMSIDEFYNYAFDVMNVDYSNMRNKLEPLKDLMEKTDKVRMIGPNTDINFSIKGMPAIICCGNANIPDGEIYTAPIKDSVNGIITYNTPSPYRSNVYNNISLVFENGKIVSATCDGDNKLLNEIFDTDKGARYIGEFSFGVNPKILYPMGDILYDEKIKGSIHFTPGMAYANCDNGNRSDIHWDLVWIQREEYGGGEVYFDDVLVRKDGIFVLDELKDLNNL